MKIFKKSNFLSKYLNIKKIFLQKLQKILFKGIKMTAEYVLNELEIGNEIKQKIGQVENGIFTFEAFQRYEKIMNLFNNLNTDDEKEINYIIHMTLQGLDNILKEEKTSTSIYGCPSKINNNEAATFALLSILQDKSEYGFKDDFNFFEKTFYETINLKNRIEKERIEPVEENAFDDFVENALDTFLNKCFEELKEMSKVENMENKENITDMLNLESVLKEKKRKMR